MKGLTIAVTGATGFLGGAIVDELLRAGATVRAVVRSPQKAQGLAALGVEIARADLLDRPALTDALLGADAVIANAALYVMEPRPWAEFYAANVTGSENLCDAAADAGVDRIVHVSTCGTYRVGPSAAWTVIDEDSPRLTEHDRGWTWAYMVTKSMGESVFWERAARYGQRLTVTRPAGIFGPGDTQVLPKLARLARLPLAPLPTFGFPMSYVDDIAQGVVAALGEDAVGKAYNLANEPVSLVQLLRAWREVTGEGPRVLPVPVPVGVRYSYARAARELGYANRPLVESMRLSLR